MKNSFYVSIKWSSSYNQKIQLDFFFVNIKTVSDNSSHLLFVLYRSIHQLEIIVEENVVQQKQETEPDTKCINRLLFQSYVDRWPVRSKIKTLSWTFEVIQKLIKINSDYFHKKVINPNKANKNTEISEINFW